MQYGETDPDHRQDAVSPGRSMPADKNAGANSTCALIIRPGALGDTLVALPALAEMKGRVDIAFAGRLPGLRFLAGHVKRTLDFESSGWHSLFSNASTIIPPEDLCPGVVAAFLGDRDGQAYRNLSKRYPGAGIHMFPSLPGEGRAGHVARYVAECLNGAGLPVDPDRAMARCRSAPLLGGSIPPEGRTKLVLHPGSGSPAKNYPLRFWSAVVGALRTCADFSHLAPCILAGPAEMEALPAIEKAFKGSHAEFMVRPGLAELNDIMAKAALYVGHDSGITHLAAMSGAPTVALFKATRPDRWQPLGPLVAVIPPLGEENRTADRVVDAGRTLQNRQRRSA